MIYFVKNLDHKKIMIGILLYIIRYALFAYPMIYLALLAIVFSFDSPNNNKLFFEAVLLGLYMVLDVLIGALDISLYYKLRNRIKKLYIKIE